jgi:hypothetical protein
MRKLRWTHPHKYFLTLAQGHALLFSARLTLGLGIGLRFDPIFSSALFWGAFNVEGSAQGEWRL